MTPRGGAIFGPRGNNLNKLGRGPLGDATYQYKGSRPYGFRLDDFFMFGRGLLGDATYQISRL